MRLAQGRLSVTRREDAGPIAVTIKGPLAARLRALAVGAGQESAGAYCVEALESWVMEHRSGKERVDPTRHDARLAEDWEAVG